MKRIGIKFHQLSGGLFAHIMWLFASVDVYIERGLINWDDSIYVDLSRPPSTSLLSQRNLNLFNYLFDQEGPSDNYLTGYAKPKWPSPRRTMRAFYESGCREKLRNIFQRFFKINPDIIAKAEDMKKNFVGKTLGVHVRLTDMNRIHGDWQGRFFIKDYISKIKQVIELEKIDTVFIASDNHVSLGKLQKIYPDLLYHKNFARHHEEICGSNMTERSNVKNIDVQKQAMIESLTLSKCDVILGRASNLFFATAIWEDIKKYYDFN